MSDEVVKGFLEQFVQGLDLISNGFKLLLQNYGLREDKEDETLEDAISVEEVRELLITKVHEGKSEQIKELLNVFKVEKLSDLRTEHYQELYDMAKKV